MSEVEQLKAAYVPFRSHSAAYLASHQKLTRRIFGNRISTAAVGQSHIYMRCDWLTPFFGSVVLLRQAAGLPQGGRPDLEAEAARVRGTGGLHHHARLHGALPAHQRLHTQYCLM